MTHQTEIFADIAEFPGPFSRRIKEFDGFWSAPGEGPVAISQQLCFAWHFA
jgi:hypothetical protein